MQNIIIDLQSVWQLLLTNFCGYWPLTAVGGAESDLGATNQESDDKPAEGRNMFDKLSGAAKVSTFSAL